MTIPTWATYTARVGTANAQYLEKSAAALGGLRITDVIGAVALDDEAVAALERQPEDANGFIDRDSDGHLTMWLQGNPHSLEPMATDGEYATQMAAVCEYLRRVGAADREQIRRATGVPWHTLARAAAGAELSNMYGELSLPMQTSFDSPGEDD